MIKVLIIQHIPYEGPGTIGSFLRERSIAFSIKNLYTGGDKLDSSEEFSHLVVMGGFMGVYEANNYPFLMEEMKFMEAFAKQGKKILGVCLGAQMLAHIMGGKVFKGERGEEIGWYEIFPTKEGLEDKTFSQLFSETNRVFAFQWHGDTFDLPTNAILLGSTEAYPNQAFSIESRLYGLQFHIEVTPQMIKEWFPKNPEWYNPPDGWGNLHRKAFKFYEDFFLG